MNKYIKLGIIIILGFFAVFVLWGLIAPINSAAVTQGSIVLDSDSKIIQHLEGGIINKILIKEGDLVKKDDDLIILSKTAVQANLDLLENQLRAGTANETRLNTELAEKDNLFFKSDILKDKTNPDIIKIIETQQNLFKLKKQAISGKIDILNKQIEQLNEQIQGFQAQKYSAQKQLKLVNKEEKIVAELIKSGNETIIRLTSLQRQAVELKGNIGEFTASIARANESINQVKLEIINLKNDMQNENIAQLHEAQITINDLKEKIIAAKDILNRLIIKAPQTGIVTDLKFHTQGGVIPPGSEIMTIVPQDDELIIEANLNPQDIDVVHPGLTAKIRLLAYRSRYTPLLTGEVIHVSPDKFTDKIRGFTYYIVRIKVKDNNKTIELYPGMPAEVLIVTGKRTFFSYLIDPIKKTFRRSFRED